MYKACISAYEYPCNNGLRVVQTNKRLIKYLDCCNYDCKNICKILI